MQEVGSRVCKIATPRALVAIASRITTLRFRVSKAARRCRRTSSLVIIATVSVATAKVASSFLTGIVPLVMTKSFTKGWKVLIGDLKVLRTISIKSERINKGGKDLTSLI